MAGNKGEFRLNPDFRHSTVPCPDEPGYIDAYQFILQDISSKQDCKYLSMLTPTNAKEQIVFWKVVQKYRVSIIIELFESSLTINYTPAAIKLGGEGQNGTKITNNIKPGMVKSVLVHVVNAPGSTASAAAAKEAGVVKYYTATWRMAPEPSAIKDHVAFYRDFYQCLRDRSTHIMIVSKSHEKINSRFILFDYALNRAVEKKVTVDEDVMDFIFNKQISARMPVLAIKDADYKLYRRLIQDVLEHAKL